MMDEVREPRWRVILLGSNLGGASTHYRRISLVLLLSIAGGLLSVRALTSAAMDFLRQARNYGLRRFLLLDQWMDLLRLSQLALLTLIGIHLIWYLAHRLLPRRYHTIAHIAVVLLLLFTIAAFSLGVISPSVLTAFNLLVILLYPVVGWPLILAVTSSLLVVKFTHVTFANFPLAPGSLSDHLLVVALLFGVSSHFRTFNARYLRSMKKAQEQLEQFRSIRSLLGNGLMLVSPKLTIQSKANHQARYLLGTPLEKGSYFPDIIVELAEQGQYLKEQIVTFFDVISKKDLSDSERANINPMQQLRIFYPGGSRYLSIDAQKVNPGSKNPFMVSIVDVSSHVELQKRRSEWLSEEFQQAELMRSFLMDLPTLEKTAVQLREHYLTLDRIIFEDRHRSSSQQHNPHDFARQLEQELLWLHSAMATHRFTHLAQQAARCQKEVQDYEDNSNYYNLLHLYTNIQLFIIELRRLRKVMLGVMNLHRSQAKVPLSPEERKRLMVLVQHLWAELDEAEQPS